MKVKHFLTTLFGEKCKSIEEFAKFVSKYESLLQSYPETQQKKILSHKFPDSDIDSLNNHYLETPIPCNIAG